MATSVLATYTPSRVGAQEAAAKPAYYIEKVQPIFQQQCGRCHLGGSARGGFSMATKADFLRGGDLGPAIVAGDPANSLLVKMIRHEEGHPPMPPGGDGLSTEEIATVSNWVKAGAIMPDVTPAGTPTMPRNEGARPQAMDIVNAKKMLAAVEAAAEQRKQHVAICVMDVNGDIVAFERMNLTGRIPLSTAEGKARTVLMFGVPTATIAEAQREKKPFTATLNAPPIGMAGGADLIFMAGGLPIIKDGKMIGAIGVGGSASEEDERFAQIGIDAAGLTSSSSISPAKQELP